MIRRWIIWSQEHRAWWRANKSGYCEELLGAGLYTEEESAQIVQHSDKLKAKRVEFVDEVNRLAKLNAETSVVNLLAALLAEDRDYGV